MASKPTSRQSPKKPEPEIFKESKEIKSKDRSKSVKVVYRTKLLANCEINDQNPLTWMDLSADDIHDLISFPEHDLPWKIAAVFQYNDWKSDLREAVWVSTHVGCLKFAKDSDFSPAQISTFFSIYKSSIEKLSKMEVSNVISYFRNMIISHSGRIGDDWDVFGAREAKLCIDYAFSTLFQHFRLYQQFLMHEQEILEISSVKSLLVPVAEPLPLAEAMTKSQYLLETGQLNSGATEDSGVSEADGSENLNQDISESVPVEKDIREDLVQENLLDVLSPEEIQKITADTINSMFSSVNQDYDALFEEQKVRFMSQISKLVSN